MESLSRSDALRFMREAADAARESFRIDGISVALEEEYLNSDFDPCDEQSAKYLTVSLVIRIDGLYTEELAISLGAKVKRGKVDSDALSSTAEDFRKAIQDVLCEIERSDDRAATLTELSRKAEEDYDLLIKKVHKAERRAWIYSALAMAIIVGAMVVTTVFA